AAVGLLPQGPPARIGGQEVEAAERRPHDPLLAQRDRHDPGIAPQLAVSDDVEAGGLLERDGLPHGAIFHGAKLGIRDGAGAHAGARLKLPTTSARAVIRSLLTGFYVMLPAVKAIGLYRYLPVDDPEALLDLEVEDPRA